MTNQFKFYEVSDPYYSLIKATSLEEAKDLYITLVADDEEGTLNDYIKEVPSDYAIANYSRGLSENKEEIPLEEILNDLRSENPLLLLVDSNIL